jgi:hypothetical protein
LIASLAEGKSVDAAVTDVARVATTSSRRGKKKKKITSPTTVSQFFAAAAKGELGVIASQTPSTKDIEPTVAIDITNNHFSFKTDIKVKSVNPEGVAREVNTSMESFWRTKMGAAAQTLNSNIAR